MMDTALKRLVKRMPPPTDPPYADVDWSRLEEAVGLTYPASFKDYIRVYGGCVWLDNVSPFYTEAKTDAEVKEFLKRVKANLKPLENNVYDQHFSKLDIPLYPVEGGLFPFMLDYSSNLFCWRTEQKAPAKWPVVCWLRGQSVVMEKMSIAKMIIDFLEGKPNMVQVWGDINLYEPERIRLDCSLAAKKGEAKKKRKK